MAMSVVLRESTDADRAFLLDVFAGTRRLEVEALGGGAVAREFVVGQWDAKRRSARSTHRDVIEQIIVADGCDAGYVVWAVDAPDSVYVIDLAVSEALRGTGVGSAAMADVLARADELGATVSLHVEHGNRARRLYERLGFVEVARDERVARMDRRPLS
jgi:ribosomal protein S18 acetylase RimI-like enzyme